MKVFWWQGGLHAEPESAEEGKAMMLLWNSVQRTSISGDGGDEAKTAKSHTLTLPSRGSKELTESIVAD
jgi:hypothetical protein